jgi:hypothetical protein
MTNALGLALSALLLPAQAPAPAPAPAPAAREKVSAPVVYEGLMLVVTTKDGVAAFAFGKEVPRGVGYRWRFLPAGGGKEQSGEGKVFEKYSRGPVVAPGGRVVQGVQDEGGQLFLAAGPVKVEWSYSAAGRGWVYYLPEQARVQIAGSRGFEKADLRRFLK